MTGLAKVITIIFIVLGLGLGYMYITDFLSGRNLRTEMLSLNDQLYDSPRIDPVNSILLFFLMMARKNLYLELKMRRQGGIFWAVIIFHKAKPK